MFCVSFLLMLGAYSPLKANLLSWMSNGAIRSMCKHGFCQNKCMHTMTPIQIINFFFFWFEKHIH